MLAYVWLIPAIPALSFVLILAFGKRLPRGGSEIGIAAVALCFVLALGTGVGWIQRVNHPPEVAHATEEASGGHAAEEEGAAAAEEEHAEEGAAPAEEDEEHGAEAASPAAEEDRKSVV